MAVNPAPLIIGGAALLALLLGSQSGNGGGGNGGGGNGGGDGNGGRKPLGPIPVPSSDEDLRLVDLTICDCWEKLGKVDDLATLRSCVGEVLHPDVQFPPISGDHATVSAVWELFGKRIQAFLAAADKQAWCDGLEPYDPVEVLEEWISEKAVPGKFYVIGTDPEKGGSDSLSGITRRALNRALPGAGNDGGNRLEYGKCITSGPAWNWPLYASSSFSETFPEYNAVNGMGLRRAFFPWHEDARKALVQRKFPKRAVTQSGSRISGVGSSYAMLWLPPVNKELLEQGIVTCDALEWSDGSSTINPPPEILDWLEKQE
jgi:hypothetical protein